MANKDLVSRNDNALSVENANKLLNLREKVKQNTALVSDEWLDRLIKWANKYKIPSKKVEFYKCPALTPECEIEPFYKNYFPRDKDELRKLKGFYVDCRWIDDLPDEFGNLTEIEFLYIQGLKAFPNTILKLKKLKWLELVCKEWSIDKLYASLSLPKEFAQLSNLVVLEFYYYDLGRFPKVILQLKKLYSLSLRGCGLKAIPRGLEVLSKQLGIIKLGGNHKLKNVPSSLYKFTKLWFLNLTYCGLTALPKRFARLQSLKILTLYSNNFTEFPQVIFELKNLKSLHINKNLITPEINEKLQKMGIDVS